MARPIRAVACIVGLVASTNWATATVDAAGVATPPPQPDVAAIAERILALKDAGADLALLAFLHFQEEVAYFGAHVIPRVRALEAARDRRAEAA